MHRQGRLSHQELLSDRSFYSDYFARHASTLRKTPLVQIVYFGYFGRKSSKVHKVAKVTEVNKVTKVNNLASGGK
jgi:hypothetical protein